MLSEKTPSWSETEQVQIVLSQDINGYKRLFGGELLEWIDVVAAVVARRHSEQNVTTVFVDHLHFKRPARANDTIVLKGKLTYVGNTSMEVRVDTYVEKLNCEKEIINTAYFVLVALDENETPVKVPGLLPQTDEEKLEWEAGKKRSAQRKSRV